MYTVLFADDTDLVRNLLCGASRQAGYSVLEAGDGYEGLLLSRHHKGPIDHPESNVLFISGYPADMPEQNLSFLQKPFTPVTLISRVAEILSESEAGLRLQGAGLSH